MKFSEAPLMQPLLCKHAKTVWSDVFEVMKLGLSPNERAVYVRVTLGVSGQQSSCHHYWRETADLDEKWELVDILSPEWSP